MTAKKNKVTDKQANRQDNGVTSSLLELLVAAKHSRKVSAPAMKLLKLIIEVITKL